MDVSSRHGLKHLLCRSVLVSRSLFQFPSFSSPFCNLNSRCLCLFLLSVFILFCAKFPGFTVTSFGKIPSDHSSKYCKFLIWDFRVWVLYTFGFSLSVCGRSGLSSLAIVLRPIPSACLVPSVSVTGKFPSDLS